MKNLIRIIILLLICSVSLINVADSKAKEKIEYNIWTVYWDMPQKAKQWDFIDKKYNSSSFFASYFNKNEELFIPEKILSNIKNSGHNKKYLTFVNDVLTDDKTKFKDINIVKDVLSDEQKQKKHADMIIKLTKEAKCTGIDLDYEQVFKDEHTSKLYLDFIKLLYKKALKENLDLRVVLEPNVDFAKYKFPKGPQYIVMLYNLYGTHSEVDGPKANYAFIEKVINKMDYLPNNRGVALSTGGCYWSSTGNKKFITTKEAEKLINKYKIMPKRDNESMALYFEYNDEMGVNYKIWYADDITMKSWINKVEELGIENISIWKFDNR